MRDSRPARHPLDGREVKRNHVEARQENAVERSRRSNEVLPCRGAEHRCDHRIDRLRFDPHVVAAALLIGCRRAPIEQLLVAGRERLLPSVLDHVEVESDAASFILGRVDGTDARFNSGTLEIADERQGKALLVAGRRENFK